MIFISNLNKKVLNIKIPKEKLTVGLNQYNKFEIEVNKEEQEDNNIDVNSFWTIFRTMVLSEFFDRTQISTLSMSSIFNFSGVLIGSSIALTITCYLGSYHGNSMTKILREKILCFLLGCIFIAYGIQVYIGKKISLK